jgi:hypothetical protein
MDRHGETSPVQAPVHRAGLPADDRGDGLSARQPVLDVYRNRRRPGLRACLFAGGLRHPDAERHRLKPGGKYEFKDGKSELLRLPKLFFDNNYGGKPVGIDTFIGKRATAAFGNSTGDQQMLEYTKSGSGARLSMLVLHDEDKREFAYGPAQGLPDTKVGTFTRALYTEATKSGWPVISIKHDWKRIFATEA